MCAEVLEMHPSLHEVARTPPTAARKMCKSGSLFGYNMRGNEVQVGAICCSSRRMVQIVTVPS